MTTSFARRPTLSIRRPATAVTNASHGSIEAFVTAVAGRRIESVGRRAKLVVMRLSGDAALTIHLKMTGQLFVVPASAASDRHVHVRLALDDGREIRFRDARKFGRIGLWPVDPVSRAVLAVEGARELFAGHGPEPLEDAFTPVSYTHLTLP